MKKLVGNQNEMNYKVLYESAMRKIAKLEQELAETKEELEMETTRADAMYDCWQSAEEDLRKANQKAQLFDSLLCDTMVAYYSDEECDNFQEIIDEHKALKKGKTTGYEYTSNKEDQAKLLAGYELINNEEETDMNNNDIQVIRKQIVELLQKDGAEDVMEALIGVFEDYSPEDGYYVPNDETGLNYLLKRHFSNDLTVFSQWVASIKFESSNAPYYFRLTNDGEIICESYLDVFADLIFFVQQCPDEALDRMIVSLDELELW